MVLAAHRLEFVRIETQRLENGRRDLPVRDALADISGVELRIGDDEQDVGVILGETAVFGDLLAALAVDRAGDRLDDDIRRTAGRRIAEPVDQLFTRINLLDVSLVAAFA